MNLVDWVILGIIGISVLFGMYRGFIASVLDLGGAFASFLMAFPLYPRLAMQIQNNESLQRTLLHYTDASSRLGDLELALTNAVSLGREGITRVLEKVSLPAPLDAILQTNLQSLVYDGQGVSGTVADYISQTILQSCINIICFLVCFFGVYLAVSITLGILRSVFRYPMLRHLDGTAGGAFGFLRGLLICLAVFTVVPLVQTIVPLDLIDELLEESALADIFRGGNLITAIMNRKLF